MINAVSGLPTNNTTSPMPTTPMPNNTTNTNDADSSHSFDDILAQLSANTSNSVSNAPANPAIDAAVPMTTVTTTTVPTSLTTAPITKTVITTPPAVAPTVTTTTTATPAKTTLPPTPPIQKTPPTPPKKKSSKGLIIGAIILLALTIGGIASYFLAQQKGVGENRQQASGGNNAPGCGTTCASATDCPSGFTCTNHKCDAASCHVAETSAACALSFTVPNINSNVSCQKTAYRDELTNSAGNYNLVQTQSVFFPGDTVVFKVIATNTSPSTIQISLTDPLTGSNLDQFTFLDSDCGAGAYNAATRTLTCPQQPAATTAGVTHIFRVKLSTTVVAGTVLTNTAKVAATSGVACSASFGTTQCPANMTCDQNGTTPQCVFTAACSVPVTVGTPPTSPTPTPTPTPTPSPTPTPTPNIYSCNSPCTADSQCQSVNSGYVCASDQGNTCRLDVNRSSTTCTPPANTYSCNSTCSTDAQCQTANSSYICYFGNCRLNSNPTVSSCQPQVTPSPTPQVGCNQSCSTNADCANSSYICSDTNIGRRCRLQNYVNSETCTPPQVTYVYQPTPAPQATPQPKKPVKIPVAGNAQNTLQFVGIGAGTLIIGAIGLLLL